MTTRKRKLLFQIHDGTYRRRQLELIKPAQSEIFSYIDGYYNRIRKHSTLGYKSPLEFEKELKIKNLALPERQFFC